MQCCGSRGFEKWRGGCLGQQGGAGIDFFRSLQDQLC